MDENEKTTQEQTQSTEDNGKRDNSQTLGLIDRAYKENQRMEANLKKREELLAKEEEFYAIQRLGGRSEAGIVAEKPKELTPLEYADALEKGLVNPMKEDGIKY